MSKQVAMFQSIGVIYTLKVTDCHFFPPPVPDKPANKWFSMAQTGVYKLIYGKLEANQKVLFKEVN